MSKTRGQGDVVDNKNKEVKLRVSASTNVGNLAGATWKYIQDGYKTSHSAIGAGAVNQAMKALALARNMALEDGKSLMVVPVFETHEIEGLTRSTMRFYAHVEDLREVIS